MAMLTPKRLRVIKTCNLYLCFFVLGLCVAVPGPTLLELQNIVNTDTKTIAFIYTARSFGYLLGSLIGGVMFDMIEKKQFVLTLFNFVTSISMLAIPWSRQLGVLTAWISVNGLSLGILDTGGNVCCLNLWGKDSGPFYQALHFTFGIGGLVAPLIAAPFLSSEEDTANGNTTILTNLVNSTNISFLPPGTNDSIRNIKFDIYSDIPTVTYAYTTIGCFALLVSVLFLCVCIISPVDDNCQKEDETKTSERSMSFLVTVVFLTFLLLFVETGTEIGYAQMLTTYAVKGRLQLSSTTGSYMTSAFWAAFTVSRFVTIFVAIKISNLTLIVFDIVVSSAGAVVLLFFGTSHEWALWTASILLGVGIASFFPAAIGWIEKYITVTNKIASFMVVGAAFGEMVVPFTISSYIDVAPEVLLYVVTASCGFSLIIVIILYFILKNKPDKYLVEGTTNAACDLNAYS